VKYSYYPGCSLSSTGLEYGLSTRYVAKKIGMELHEIPDWNCCGATAAHSMNHDLALALPARNLALVEKQGLGLEIAIPCAACYSRMKYAIQAARSSEKERQKIEEIIEMPYEAKNDAICLLEAFAREDAQAAVKEKIVKSLNGLKVASYYGCLLVRPAGVTQFDDNENPQSMDNLMTLIGAKPVNWAFKTECCGASHQVDAPKVARPLIYNILRNAKANGAEAIVTACPLCMMNLDMREFEFNKAKKEFDIPVYYFTELLGMAMGADPKELGMEKHFTPAVARIKEAFKRPPEEEKPIKKAKAKVEEVKEEEKPKEAIDNE